MSKNAEVMAVPGAPPPYIWELWERGTVARNTIFHQSNDEATSITLGGNCLTKRLTRDSTDFFHEATSVPDPRLSTCCTCSLLAEGSFHASPKRLSVTRTYKVWEEKEKFLAQVFPTLSAYAVVRETKRVC